MLPPRGRDARAHAFQFFAGRPFTPAQPLQPPRRTNFDPVCPPGRPPRAHLTPFFATAPGIKTTTFTAFGPAGAATFILALEPGTKVIHSWSTDIITMYSGAEQRISPFGQPRRRFEGTAFILDGPDRDVRGALMRAASQGATFLIALPHEELTLVADSSARTVFVTSTAMSDWLLTGQRVAIVGVDGTTATAVVQTFTSGSILLDVVLGNIGRAGGRIMPLVPVLFDTSQGFARYPTNVDLWALRAQANAFGWVGQDAMGVGASLTTFTLGVPVPVASLINEDLLIWDRSNAVDDTSTESMISSAEVVDLGALPFAIGGTDAPDWMRSIKYQSSSLGEWQWFKAFLRFVRGRQRAFLLSTNRPDLVFDSLTSDGIKVKSASVSGGGDYVSWYVSAAYKRLAITLTNGTVLYREVVIAPVDNGDGTLTLTLDQNVAGTVGKISFLEQVRFESDDITATWDGGVFSIDEVAHAVQDAIDTASLRLFDKVINSTFAYSGIPPDVPPAFQEFGGQLGKTTLINFTSDRSLNFSGIVNTMPGGNTDGQIVCISNINTTSSAYTMGHEDTHSTGNHRCWNSGQASVTGVGRAAWWRFNGSVGRWIQIM